MTIRVTITGDVSSQIPVTPSGSLEGHETQQPTARIGRQVARMHEGGQDRRGDALTLVVAFLRGHGVAEGPELSLLPKLLRANRQTRARGAAGSAQGDQEN